MIKQCILSPQVVVRLRDIIFGITLIHLRDAVFHSSTRERCTINVLQMEMMESFGVQREYGSVIGPIICLDIGGFVATKSVVGNQ